jgi:hypothetical protein
VKAHRKETVVDAEIAGPRGGMVTQALTSPYAVIAIPKTTHVRWVDGPHGNAEEPK